MRRLLSLVAGATGAFASACQTAPAAAPAVLADDEEAMAALKETLADALGVARVTLGAGAPTTEPLVAVLPPPNSPLETRNVATPVVFDILLSTRACVLVRRDTKERFEMAKDYCKAL